MGGALVFSLAFSSSSTHCWSSAFAFPFFLLLKEKERTRRPRTLACTRVAASSADGLLETAATSGAAEGGMTASMRFAIARASSSAFSVTTVSATTAGAAFFPRAFSSSSTHCCSSALAFPFFFSLLLPVKEKVRTRLPLTLACTRVAASSATLVALRAADDVDGPGENHMVPAKGAPADEESACCERRPEAISLRRNSQYVAVRYERSPFLNASCTSCCETPYSDAIRRVSSLQTGSIAPPSPTLRFGVYVSA